MNKKQRIKYSKIIVLLCIVLVIMFTPMFLYSFIRVGSEPVVLIGAFFSFVTIELWNMKDIKKSEYNKENNSKIIPDVVECNKGEDLSGE